MAPLSLKQYSPPRGPVQVFPDRHEQPSAVALCGTMKLSGGCVGALEQIFLEALIEPSLQTKLAPAHFATPPLLPEHG